MDEYFTKLKDLSQQVDRKTRKLTRIWESPHLLIGGNGENVEDASPHLERFLSDLNTIQDQLINDRESRINHINITEKYLSGVQDYYDDVKQQCDELEDMLLDYGYKPIEEEESLPTDESEKESSILTTSQMNYSSALSSNGENENDAFPTPSLKPELKSIATPVITSLASAMKLAQNRQNNGNPQFVEPKKKFLIRLNEQSVETIKELQLFPDESFVDNFHLS